MENDKSTFEEIGNEVMKAVGALDEATQKTKADKETCDASQDEVGSWISVIGKAILTIFK